MAAQPTVENTKACLSAGHASLAACASAATAAAVVNLFSSRVSNETRNGTSRTSRFSTPAPELSMSVEEIEETTKRETNRLPVGACSRTGRGATAAISSA